MNADLITVPEVARILGRSDRAIKARAQRNTIPYVTKLPGQTGAYLFDRAVIEKLAASMSVDDAVAAASREAADSVRGAA